MRFHIVLPKKNLITELGYDDSIQELYVIVSCAILYSSSDDELNDVKLYSRDVYLDPTQTVSYYFKHDMPQYIYLEPYKLTTSQITFRDLIKKHPLIKNYIMYYLVFLFCATLYIC